MAPLARLRSAASLVGDEPCPRAATKAAARHSNARITHPCAPSSTCTRHRRQTHRRPAMNAPLQFFSDSIATPIGKLIYICDQQGALRMLDWSDHEARALRLLDIHYGKGGYALTPKHDPFGLATRLAAYFAGDIHAIDNIPTA